MCSSATALRPKRAPLSIVRSKLLTPTIFHEPWWLAIASDGAYREAKVVTNGVVLGRLPYLLSGKTAGQNAVIMPDMTHVLGPALGTEGGDSTRSLKHFTITSELIAQLPKAAHTWFRLHRGVTDTLAFEAAGFSTGVDFTIEVAPDASDKLWKRMRDKTRNVIRRAGESLSVVECHDAARFLRFYDTNLADRGMRNQYNREVCTKLIVACLARAVGRLLIASDASGALKAGVFTVLDGETEYYFMSTRTLDSGNGATSLLIWSAIQHAAALGLTFNTDGLNSKNNLLLLTGFGGVLKPRYFVSKTSKIYQTAQFLKGLF